jgi:hypothetical protein
MTGTKDIAGNPISIHYTWHFTNLSFINKIAFRQSEPEYDMDTCGGQCEDIWIMNADGSNLMKITNDPGQHIYPAWGSH